MFYDWLDIILAALAALSFIAAFVAYRGNRKRRRDVVVTQCPRCNHNFWA